MSARALELRRSAASVRIPALIETHGLTLATAALAAALLVVLTATTGMMADSWLTLVAGREVAGHGLQARDHLAAVTLGRRWVDQQWLAQVALYELHRFTRDAFPLVVSLVVSIPALLAAVVLGRRRSSDRAVAATVLVAAVPFISAAADTRTQSLAYLAFVALLALLIRPQTWRVRIAALAVIAIWANLHGSVLLGAAAASLCWLQDIRLHRGRAMLLGAAAWPATLCSPYALDLPSYYRSTLGNSAFAEVLVQWKPLGLNGRAAPTWLLIAVLIWIVARARRRPWSFEPALLLVLAALTIHTARMAPFLALAAVALLPPLVERGAPARPASGLRAPIVLASLTLAVLLMVAAVTDVRFSPLRPDAAAAAAEGAGSGKVFVPLELGDWLLWEEPDLRGRVAADARAELLTTGELRQFTEFWRGARGWQRATAGYRSFMLSPTDERWLVRRLVSLPRRFRVVYRDTKVVVFVRRAATAT